MDRAEPMTAVDHAELKRLAVVLSDKDIDSYKMPGKTANVWAARLTALLSEIEGLKAERDALRTQAPDSWRPEADELLCRWLGQSCDDDGVPELQAATRAFIKTLRPKTAESGK